MGRGIFDKDVRRKPLAVAADAVAEVGDIALNAGEVAADRFHRRIKFLLATDDENIGTFRDKTYGGGQCHSRSGSGDDRDLSFELSDDFCSS